MNDYIDQLLCIDIGGTKIITALVDASGNISARNQVSTPARGGPDTVIEAVMESAEHTCNKAGISPRDIQATGVAVAGLVNSEEGIVYSSPNLSGWTNVPLSSRIQERLGHKVFIINDANAAAIGEHQFGAGRGCNDFVYLTVSTGIGGGIFGNGKLYGGTCGLAGELGHMVIDQDGPVCLCGNRGCLEILASGRALERSVRQKLEAGAASIITQRVDGNFDRIDARIIHAAAIEGDSMAIESIGRIAYYLGIGMASIVNIFNPERLILGGGLTNLGDMLLVHAYKEAERRAFSQPLRSARFMVAELGADSGIIGASLYTRQQLRY